MLAGGLLSPIPSGLRLLAALVGTIVILAAELGVRGLQLPQTAQQIPATVVAVRRPANAWRFAVPYGTGLRTYLPSASPHVLALWLVLAAPSLLVPAAAASFGVGRGISLLMRSLTRRRLDYGRSFERLTELLRPISPVLVLVLALVASLRS